MIVNKSINKITVLATKVALSLLGACIIWISGYIINVDGIVIWMRISIKSRTVTSVIVTIIITVITVINKLVSYWYNEVKDIW